MRKGINNMWSGYIDRISKYFHECITCIKVKKSKEDNKKLKKLNSKLSELEKETEIAYEKYNKLSDKCGRVSNSIDKINKRYAYRKRIKVPNPSYVGNEPA